MGILTDVIGGAIKYAGGHLSKAIDRHLESAAEFKRCYNLLELKKYDEALIMIEKAIENDVEPTVNWCWRGICLMELSRYDEATYSLDKCKSLVEDDGPLCAVLFFLKAKICILQSNEEESLKNLETAFLLDVELQNEAIKDAVINRLSSNAGYISLISSDPLKGVREILKKKDKIAAIKFYRNLTGTGLAYAKHVVDQLESEHHGTEGNLDGTRH